MTAKKATAERKATRTGQYVTKAVLERRTAIKNFVNYAERIAQDRGKSQRVARQAGIVTASGRLTQHYKK